MAWLTGWNIRKLLYLNGSSAGNQTNYQMKLTINYGNGTDGPGNIYCNSQCKTDFSDIRFTSSDGSTPLNYWIETYTPSSNATVWIKIASISTGSNSTYIFFYYNYPSAISASNGINTFIAFFDFENDTVGSLPSGWTSSGGTTAVVANDHAAEGSSKSLKIVEGGSNGQWHSSLLGGGNVPYNNYAVEFWVYSTGNHYIFMGTTPTQSAYTETWGYIDIRSGVDRWWWKDGTAGPGYSPYNNGVWHHVVATHNSSNIQSVFVDGTNLNVDYNYTSDANFNVGNLKYFSGLGGTTLGTIWFDNIFIRNFVSTEPSWGSIGPILNITSTPTGAEVWLRTPSCTGTCPAYIDQGVVTGTTISVVPGTYDVELTLSGGQTWYLLNQTFNNGNTYNIQANFPGQLTITSTPSGAEIFLGGEDRHVVTNTTILGLNPSPPDYNITLKLANYQDWTGTATVYSNLTTSVIAKFAGSANITSTPSSAAIYLDGSLTSIGNTPLIITNLTPATSDESTPTLTHTYILKLTGYADTSGSFIATAGQTISVPVTFPGSLNITSIPVGAQIYIDGVLQ